MLFYEFSMFEPQLRFVTNVKLIKFPPPEQTQWNGKITKMRSVRNLIMEHWNLGAGQKHLQFSSLALALELSLVNCKCWSQSIQTGQSDFWSEIRKKRKQAGAELCQAKHRLS